MGKCKIAILDSGLDLSFCNQPNVYFEGNVSDDNGHGTMCYSLIHSISNESEFYIIKILDSNLFTTSERLLYELDMLVKQDINIINLSLSTSSIEYEKELRQVCSRLNDEGKLLVASHDNNLQADSYPCDFVDVIGVKGGISDSNYNFEYNKNRKVQAVCNRVPSLVRGKGELYSFFGGTSKAAACMTGIIATHWNDIEPMVKNKTAEIFLEKVSKMGRKDAVHTMNKSVYHFAQTEIIPQIEREVTEKNICAVLDKFEKEFKVKVEYEKLLLLDFFNADNIGIKLSQLLD